MKTTQSQAVALTGGIGTGKSFVARIFESMGARIIDADLLARQVVEPGTPALAEIEQLFGRQVLLADGSLKREALATIIFADRDKRRQLEDILHPRIRTAFSTVLNHQTTAPLTLYVVPLYFESRRPFPEISSVIVVTAPEEICISRVMQRDKLTREQALQRVHSQLPLAEKEARANWVIHNDSTREALIPQVEKLYGELTKA